MNEYYDDEDLRQFYYRRPKRVRFVGDFTKFLLIACIVCFIASRFMSEKILRLFLFNSGNVLKYPWILVTNAFFHAGFEHLFVNSWAIFMFGSFLEKRVGTDLMVKLFFMSVIVANLVFGFFNPGIYGLGISGFVYAIIGSVVVLSRILGFSSSLSLCL